MSTVLPSPYSGTTTATEGFRIPRAQLTQLFIIVNACQSSGHGSAPWESPSPHCYCGYLHQHLAQSRRQPSEPTTTDWRLLLTWPQVPLGSLLHLPPHFLLLLLFLALLPFSFANSCPAPLASCSSADIVQYAAAATTSPSPKDRASANISALYGTPDYNGNRCLASSPVSSGFHLMVFSMSSDSMADRSRTQITITFNSSVLMRQVC